MDTHLLPVIAGIISTTLFALSTLPMLLKAFRTKDLKSYSLGNILLANVGNAIHSIYIFQLPVGPIWLLHSFHMVTTGLMLFWYLRYEKRPSISRRFRVKILLLRLFFRSIPQPLAPVHQHQYPAGITLSGHDGG